VGAPVKSPIASTGNLKMLNGAAIDLHIEVNADIIARIES
jgi:hypothetical protein